jgi:hypothetical protein
MAPQSPLNTTAPLVRDFLDKLQDDAETAVRKLSDIEISELSEALKTAFDPATAVSILLFQHFPTQGRHAGRFVDVGPRPPAAPKGTIVQNASSGMTGRVFDQKDTPLRWVPKSDLIDRETVDDYIASNPDESARRNQVAVEKARYGIEVEFKRTDAPPEGALIHQQSLTPHPETRFPRKPPRYPNLGMVYTVSNNVEQSAMQVQLPLFATAAGDAAIDARLLALLGEERHRAAADLARAPDRAKEASLYRVVGTVILAHHWIYAHDPVAWKVLRDLVKLSRGVVCVQDHEVIRATDAESLDRCIRYVYERHLFLPPLNSDDSPLANLSDALSLICNDVTQIARYCRLLESSGNHSFDSAIEVSLKVPIRRAVWTMCNLLAGKLLTVENWDGRKQYVIATENLNEDARFALVANPKGALGEELDIPAFELEPLVRAISRRTRSSAKDALNWIAPGNAPYKPVRGKTDPAFFVSKILEQVDENSWRVKIEPPPRRYKKRAIDKDHSDSCFYDFARTLTDMWIGNQLDKDVEVQAHAT